VVRQPPDGRIVAVEVKASTIARAADAIPMARLRDRLDTDSAGRAGVGRNPSPHRHV
jgi:hypothetical protein